LKKIRENTIFKSWEFIVELSQESLLQIKQEQLLAARLDDVAMVVSVIRLSCKVLSGCAGYNLVSCVVRVLPAMFSRCNQNMMIKNRLPTLRISSAQKSACSHRPSPI